MFTVGFGLILFGFFFFVFGFWILVSGFRFLLKGAWQALTRLWGADRGKAEILEFPREKPSRMPARWEIVIGTPGAEHRFPASRISPPGG